MQKLREEHLNEVRLINAEGKVVWVKKHVNMTQKNHIWRGREKRENAKL